LDEVKGEQSIINERRNKEIQIEFAPLENDIIKGDQSMLEVIFRNLLTNAIKFSHRGKSIEIKIEQEVEALVFSVTDHGIGIEKQHQDSLFKLDGKFRQIGTEDEVSSGLGLILVKEFTMQNLGKVWLESTPGEGTTFYLSFPPA